MKAKKIYELHRADNVKPSIDLSIGGGVIAGGTFIW